MSKSPQPNNGMHPTRDTAALIIIRGAGGRVMPGVRRRQQHTSGEMRVDVSLTYQNGQLHIRSEAAHYIETRPALILLSRGADGVELIEAVGYYFGVEERKAAWERDKGSRTYRCFDPFESLRFEPEAAAAVVRHLCLYAHASVKPRRGLWRALWGLDKFRVRVKIAGYRLVPAERRADFERRLRKRVGKVEVSD